MAGYEHLEKAEALVKRRLAVAGFGDLAEVLYVMPYTTEEMDDLGATNREWVGQYVAGSVDNDQRGAVVLVYLDKHKDENDLAETIAHMLAYALWELLDEESQNEWLKSKPARSFKHGPKAAFADDFMYFIEPVRHLMRNETLFRKIAVDSTPAK